MSNSPTNFFDAAASIPSTLTSKATTTSITPSTPNRTPPDSAAGTAALPATAADPPFASPATPHLLPFAATADIIVPCHLGQITPLACQIIMVCYLVPVPRPPLPLPLQLLCCVPNPGLH